MEEEKKEDKKKVSDVGHASEEKISKLINDIFNTGGENELLDLLQTNHEREGAQLKMGDEEESSMSSDDSFLDLDKAKKKLKKTSATDQFKFSKAAFSDVLFEPTQTLTAPVLVNPYNINCKASL